MRTAQLECGVAQIRAWSLCFSFGREVRVLVETRPSRWSEARDGMSLVIFRQPTCMIFPPREDVSADCFLKASAYYGRNNGFLVGPHIV